MLATSAAAWAQMLTIPRQKTRRSVAPRRASRWAPRPCSPPGSQAARKPRRSISRAAATAASGSARRRGALQIPTRPRRPSAHIAGRRERVAERFDRGSVQLLEAAAAEQRERALQLLAVDVED